MIIIGLGNPDKKYEDTYHNVGFSVIDRLAELIDVKFKTSECKSITACYYSSGKKIILAKPQTYMNLSGEAVIELIGKYKAELEDILIIFDDIDLDIGAIRVRKDGSGGTHNGMKNIVDILSTKRIPRMRIGIGKPPENFPLINYVLAKIAGGNKTILDTAFAKAATCLRDYISHMDIDRLMRESAE